jgi:SOS response regulatory protein OraA/RecX
MQHTHEEGKGENREIEIGMDGWIDRQIDRKDLLDDSEYASAFLRGDTRSLHQLVQLALQLLKKLLRRLHSGR